MNNNIFNTIQSENVAYWLGFLAADGSVSAQRTTRLYIGLARKDREHLSKFLQFIGSDASITDYEVKCKQKVYPASSISIYSNNICNDLKSYGIIPDKSHINYNFLENIPQEYQFAFICGYFDGDGWFVNTDSTSAFGFCGNQKTMLSISIFLQNKFQWKEAISVIQDNKSSITFNLQTQAKQKIQDFITAYLQLKDSCDLLERKKAIAINLFNKIEQQNLIKQASLKTPNPNKICPICNKEFFGRAEQIYCSQVCAHIVQQKTERPTREELKKKIRKQSFLSLGQKYGISDNAVRKWCKTMNLPHTKKEINSYSDEEWEKI